MSTIKAGFFPEELLQHMRFKADPLADGVVNQLMQSGQREALNNWWTQVKTNADPVSDELPEIIRHYLAETQNLPAWANMRRIRNGHRFFARHAQPVLSILGALSLPYCYAAADGAQVLWLSQRIRQDTHQRLAETAQFLLDVMAPNAFTPLGSGIRSIQKVRLIHAVARYYAGRSSQWQSGWGVPVNQEDMAGTNLAFSYIVLQGLQKLGFDWKKPEAEDFLYTWNVIGAMLGLDEQLLPENMQAAYWLDKKIIARHFRRSEAGIGLTRALLESLYSLNQGAVTQLFTHAYMRFLLGDKVSDLLDIPPVKGGALLNSAFKSVNLLHSFLAANPERVTADLQNQLKQEVATQVQLPESFG